MKLELKHLAPYLPYKLKIKTQYGFDTMETLNDWEVNGDFEESYCYETVGTTDFKPMLRPLSYLIKTIEVDRQLIIPIDFLASEYLQEVRWSKNHIVEGFFNKDGLVNSVIMDGEILGECPLFIYDKLVEWHFDIFGLIKKNLAVELTNLKDE